MPVASLTPLAHRPWWLGVAVVLAVGTFALALLMPRPASRPRPDALLALLMMQPLSLLAGVALWPLAGVDVAAAVGLTGVTCMMTGVWLLPREDPGDRPPPGHDEDPTDGGPPGWDWTEFDRRRQQWEGQITLAVSA
jgi:hypothetical protein